MIGYSKAKQVGKREKSGLASSKVKKVISEAKPKKRRKREKKMASDLDTSGKVSKSKLWPPKRKPIKKVSQKQAKRMKKLTEIPPPEDGLCEE